MNIKDIRFDGKLVNSSRDVGGIFLMDQDVGFVALSQLSPGGSAMATLAVQFPYESIDELCEALQKSKKKKLYSLEELCLRVAVAEHMTNERYDHASSAGMGEFVTDALYFGRTGFVDYETCELVSEYFDWHGDEDNENPLNLTIPDEMFGVSYDYYAGVQA